MLRRSEGLGGGDKWSTSCRAAAGGHALSAVSAGAEVDEGLRCLAFKGDPKQRGLSPSNGAVQDGSDAVVTRHGEIFSLAEAGSQKLRMMNQAATPSAARTPPTVRAVPWRCRADRHP